MQDDDSADLYEFVFSGDDARRNADRLHEMVRVRVPTARSLLDVACGTGWHLERLREWYEVEGLDVSAGMLRHARRRLPGVTLHQADMRTFHLGRRFDVVVCLSSSIAAMTTRNDLASAVQTMARHTAGDGLLVIEPWNFPGDQGVERPWVTTVESEEAAVALAETTTLDGDLWRQETHYLVWSSTHGIEHHVQVQTLGAFTRIDYEDALADAGLSVEFEPVGVLGRGLFFGTYP